MKRKAKIEKPKYYFTPSTQEIDCTNYGHEKDAAYIKVLNGILKIPFTGVIIPKPSEILPNASGPFYPFETNIKVIEIDELPKYQTHYLWEEDDFTFYRSYYTRCFGEQVIIFQTITNIPFHRCFHTYFFNTISVLLLYGILLQSKSMVVMTSAFIFTDSLLYNAFTIPYTLLTILITGTSTIILSITT
jgi:hypothetical protein